jgi:hypothetical protein|tara:strand:- start:3878 stop:4099 length:222 start_codon:yes stop_codon:yes gene_type:complete
MLKADGFDESIIGYCYDIATGDERIIYSVQKCIEILVAEGMEEIDAIEHLEYNIMGAYVGNSTPIFLREYDEE